MRYAARIDANQGAVIDALRKAGAKVSIIGEPVDLLVGFRGRLLVMEVKDGSKPPSDRNLTKQQKTFFGEWAGYPVSLVDSPESALKAIGL